jgi:hypothetical protein
MVLSAGGCINHAHVHALPDDGSLFNELRLSLASQSDAVLQQGSRWGSTTEPYVQLKFRGEAATYRADGLPKQFLRRVATPSGGPQPWQWYIACETELAAARFAAALTDLTNEFEFE